MSDLLGEGMKDEERRTGTEMKQEGTVAKPLSHNTCDRACRANSNLWAEVEQNWIKATVSPG